MSESSALSEVEKRPSDAALERDDRLTLSDISRPVEEELDVFRDYFRDSLRTPVSLLDRVARYLLRNKGKEIRPLLVLLSAKACGRVGESSFRAAALVELLHSATLVHDDVVDDADHRRGVFSINALWKNKISVLFGDYLLSRGLLLALEHDDYDILQKLSDAVRRMSEGELLQIQKARLLDIDEETYFQIISDKTASLISACAASGALSTTADREVVEQMSEMGEKLGLAFQIRDDLFDYGLADAGKPIGIDLQEKKLTLPLIHALRSTGWVERRRIMRIVRKDKKGENDLAAIRSFVTENGGLDYARSLMHKYAREASELLDVLPPSEARQALQDLASFTVQRKK